MAANIRRDILWRIYLAFFMLCLLGLAIVGKAVKIQVSEGDYWLGLADSLTIYPKTIEADRGNIYTEDGHMLATSLPYFEVRIDFKSEAMTQTIFDENHDSLAIRMAQYVGNKTYDAYKTELRENREAGNRYYLVARKLTYPELKRIKQWPFFRLGRYKSGMVVVKHNERKMPFGMLAQRTIGYIKDDGRYRVGIEGMYDEVLTGQEGQMMVQKIAGGTLIPLEGNGEIAAVPGKDIYMTLDVNIQDVAQTALLSAIKEHEAESGSVVLMEVKTGKIRAIANIGKRQDGGYWEIKNYAVGDPFEPGSTFKLASMIALLEDGYITPNDKVNLEDGKVKFYGQWMRDAYPPKENSVTISEAFAQSSNVGISKLVNKHYANNQKQFYNHLIDMRLDQFTGIEIVGEGSPFIRKTDDWSKVSLPWMSVGYELKLTPLQILTFYNAIANEGKMVKPYLVSEIKEFNKTIEKTETIVLNKEICSEQTREAVHEMLKLAVDEGSAKVLKNSNYAVAAKTGTAQIADANTSYSDKLYNSSIVGYFPADNPIYSCMVVIHKPSKGVYYGGSVAGPVFREIADKIYANNCDMYNEILVAQEQALPNFTGMKHELAEVMDGLSISYQDVEAAWVSTKVTNGAYQMSEKTFTENRIPDVRGMGLKDALYLLENAGLTVEVIGKGKVIKQQPPAGSEMTTRNVQLELG